LLINGFDSLIFKDNIVYNTYSDVAGGLLKWYNGTSESSSLDSDYNLWYSYIGRNQFALDGHTYNSLSSFVSGQGEDSHSLSSAPSFESGSFIPTSSSTVCDAASDSTDIGAISCSVGTTPPVIPSGGRCYI
jgi:hypothetical protein